MIEFALIALAAAQAPPQQIAVPPATRQRVATARLEIPDEVAPAVVPYLRCRLASSGVPIRSPGGGPEEPPAVPVGTDCAGARSDAARLAERMLREQRRGNSEERRAFVERVLASVDTFTSAPAPAFLPSEDTPNAED